MCVVCGASMDKRLSDQTITCGLSCKMKLQWADDAYRQKIRGALTAHPACHSLVRKEQLDVARTKRTLGPAWREKMRTACRKRRVPTKLTGIEIKLRDGFTALKLDFVMHVTLFSRWQPDFVFEEAKLIVQADGDYWHGKEVTQERDARFNAQASAAGWTIWRFSEEAINTNTKGCVKAVAKFVRSAQATLPLTIQIKTIV